jgi:hypothetical protein
MVRIVFVFLLMMAMAAPASALETKAIGGFILSAHGGFEGKECPPGEHEKFCYHTTFIQMKIDGPVTNNYTAACRVFDSAGKLLGQDTAVTTRSKDKIMNTTIMNTIKRPMKPLAARQYWSAILKSMRRSKRSPRWSARLGACRSCSPQLTWCETIRHSAKKGAGQHVPAGPVDALS